MNFISSFFSHGYRSYSSSIVLVHRRSAPRLYGRSSYELLSPFFHHLEVHMRRTCWRTALVSLLAVLAAGCGGGSSAPTPTPAPSCTPSSEFAYVLSGEVTPWGNGTISVFTVNSCTGALTPATPATIATGSDPETFAVDPSGRFVYAANLVSNASDLATISMYTINSSAGVLTPTTPATVGTGFFPQGIGIDPSGKFVYTANSDDNTVSMFTVDSSTGILTPTTPPVVAAGWSPGSVTVHPSGKFAYVANQVDQTVSMYTINSTTGILTPMTPATVPTGQSPFDVTVDPSGKFAYVPNAYDFENRVSQYTIDSATGVLTPATPSAITAGNSPTCVAVDPSSKFAYVVNRQDYTVSAYTLDPASGNLSLIGTYAAGAQPWRVTVDPSGKFAYVGNENDNTVSIYRINGDGSLTSAGTTATPGPAFAISVISPKQ